MIRNLFREPPASALAQRFRAAILNILEMPPDSEEEALRGVLISRGGHILEWYENRIGAIEDSPEERAAARKSRVRHGLRAMGQSAKRVRL